MDEVSGVAELQGLYGPVRISERFLQLIWQRMRFAAGAMRAADGRTVEILAPGEWNHQEGPDFRNARWRVNGGGIREGAVELHFYVEDWARHGHHEDPNFESVGLHVVLFPPKPGSPGTTTCSGRLLPTVALLPYLEEDLESLAEEEALHELDERWNADWLDNYLAMDRALRMARLQDGAYRRFLRKTQAAEVALEAMGWDEALHRQTLEVLGYSRNRRQMREVANDFPFHLLLSESFTVETLYLSRGSSWKTSGIRPANHPRRRIGQYLDLVRSRPAWPFQAKAWGRRLCRGLDDQISVNHCATSEYRRQRQLHRMRNELREEILDEKIMGTRLETWVTEAFLPLYRAESGVDCRLLWFHWFAGDFPAKMNVQLNSLFRPGETLPTHCNGVFQGLIDLIMVETIGYEQLEFSDLPPGEGT